MYEQYHFPQKSDLLFIGYIQTFIDLKSTAKTEGNAGLKPVAKLCLNAMYGNFVYNVENQFHTDIIKHICVCCYL